MTQMAIRLYNLINIIIGTMKGEIYMVDMYVALVIAGRRTCNKESKDIIQVPTRYKNAVIAELAALGLDADGNPIE